MSLPWSFYTFWFASTKLSVGEYLLMHTASASKNQDISWSAEYKLRHIQYEIIIIFSFNPFLFAHFLVYNCAATTTTYHLAVLFCDINISSTLKWLAFCNVKSDFNKTVLTILFSLTVIDKNCRLQVLSNLFSEKKSKCTTIMFSRKLFNFKLVFLNKSFH